MGTLVLLLSGSGGRCVREPELPHISLAARLSGEGAREVRRSCPVHTWELADTSAKKTHTHRHTHIDRHTHRHVDTRTHRRCGCLHANSVHVSCVMQASHRCHGWVRGSLSHDVSCNVSPDVSPALTQAGSGRCAGCVSPSAQAAVHNARCTSWRVQGSRDTGCTSQLSSVTGVLACISWLVMTHQVDMVDAVYRPVVIQPRPAGCKRAHMLGAVWALDGTALGRMALLKM